MTLTATDLLLEATGIAKTYGAVTALKSASLAVRPGEVHALMGANGAGKSTLVKILTGAVRPDAGTIALRGRVRTVHSPAEARRSGLVSVYQEPALIPDLDIRSNLRLTETPIEPFRHWLHELGGEDLDLSTMARRTPLALLRIIDLARALAIEPDVLMLDEMTAALPADLTERVLEVMATLPRHLFVPEAIKSQAYNDNALPISGGQTISQPFIVARMTELLGLTGQEKVLEIGAGSG